MPKVTFSVPYPHPGQNFGDSSLWRRSMMLGLQIVNTPDSLTVKLFSKNSNLCDHNPPTLQTDRRLSRSNTARQRTYVLRAV